MKSNGTIRLGAALALLLAFGATSASAFTFKRHQYRSQTLRMRQTRQFTQMNLKMPRKTYAQHHSRVAITKRIFSPMVSVRTSPVIIKAVHDRRYYESTPRIMKRSQKWTPNFRNDTSYLTSAKIRPGLTGGATTARRTVAVRVQSPVRPITVAGPSTTNSVKALWGRIRVAD